MARAAGDSNYYHFILKRENGKYDNGVGVSLVRVTHVIKSTLAAPQLIPWAYRQTVDNISGLVTQFYQQVAAETQQELYDTLTDSDMLDEWLKQNHMRPDDVRDERAGQGQSAHRYLEKLCHLLLDEGAETAWKKADIMLRADPESYEGAISKWWLDKATTLVNSEIVLPSFKHGYCGTVDLAHYTDDGLTITDLKTRKPKATAYDSDHAQTGAYAIAWEELYGDRPDTRTVLVARADGTYTEYSSDGIEREVFLDLLSVFNRLKGVK